MTEGSSTGGSRLIEVQDRLLRIEAFIYDNGLKDKLTKVYDAIYADDGIRDSVRTLLAAEKRRHRLTVVILTAVVGQAAALTVSWFHS